MGAISRQIAGRVAGVVAVTVAALAMTASAASAGTLTVSITGAGVVGGSGIECERTVGDKEPQRTARCPSRAASSATRCTGVLHRHDWPPSPAAGFGFDRWTGACTGERSPGLRRGRAREGHRARHRRVPRRPGSHRHARQARGRADRRLDALEATADDNVGVDRVEFRVRGVARRRPTPRPVRGEPRHQDDRRRRRRRHRDRGRRRRPLDDHDARSTSRSTTPSPTLTVNGPNNETFGPGTTQTWTIAAGDTGGSGIFQVRCSLVTAGRSGQLRRLLGRQRRPLGDRQARRAPTS